MGDVISVQTPGVVTGPTAPTPQGQQTGTPAPERPSWLPQEFKSAEDLAKAYSDLINKNKPAAKPEAQPETKPDKPQDLSIQQQAQAKGIELAKYEAEFTEKGQLSEASYKELADKGVTKDAVDNYIQGQQARVQAFQKDLFQSVGGEDQYWKMAEWAKTTLKPDEVEAYNRVMRSNDPSAIKFAVAGLKARYTAEYGTDPKLLGGNRGTSGPAPFRDVGELQAAMSDPRYATSESYRQEVAQRLQSSNIWG